MKINQRGAVDAMMAVLLLVLLVGVGVVVWRIQSADEAVTENNNSAIDASDSKIGTSSDETDDENDNETQITKPELVKGDGTFIDYNNQALGVSFRYPATWGELKEEAFDNNENSVFYKFSGVKTLVFGGHETDYETLGRDGSLIDYGGFIEEAGVFYFRSAIDKSKIIEAEGYRKSGNGACIYSTAVEFFGATSFHASCNINKDDIYGVNLAAYNWDGQEVLAEEFTQMVESVQVQ